VKRDRRMKEYEGKGGKGFDEGKEEEGRGKEVEDRGRKE